MANINVKTAVAAINGVLRNLSPAERALTLSLVAGATPVPGDARTRITRALADTRGNVTQAAALLGCSRRALQYKMRDLEISSGSKGGRKSVFADDVASKTE